MVTERVIDRDYRRKVTTLVTDSDTDGRHWLQTLIKVVVHSPLRRWQYSGLWFARRTIGGTLDFSSLCVRKMAVAAGKLAGVANMADLAATWRQNS